MLCLTPGSTRPSDRRRADELQGRLQKRMEQLDLEEQISAAPPVILGGFVVLPIALLHKIAGRVSVKSGSTIDRQAVDARARHRHGCEA